MEEVVLTGSMSRETADEVPDATSDRCVAWQVTVVDRRRYDHWSLGRVNRRCEVGR